MRRGKEFTSSSSPLFFIEYTNGIQLEPDWFKSHGRLASAREALGQYTLAIISFREAAALATTPDQKRESELAVARLQRQISIDDGEIVPGTNDRRKPTPTWRKVERLVAQGVEFPQDSAGLKSLWAHREVQNAWKVSG